MGVFLWLSIKVNSFMMPLMPKKSALLVKSGLHAATAIVFSLCLQKANMVLSLKRYYYRNIGYTKIKKGPEIILELLSNPTLIFVREKYRGCASVGFGDYPDSRSSILGEAVIVVSRQQASALFDHLIVGRLDWVFGPNVLLK
jgi:hypothetical protein